MLHPVCIRDIPPFGYRLLGKSKSDPEALPGLSAGAILALELVGRSTLGSRTTQPRLAQIQVACPIEGHWASQLVVVRQSATVLFLAAKIQMAHLYCLRSTVLALKPRD